MPRPYPQQQKKERVAAASEHLSERWNLRDHHTTTTQGPTEPAPKSPPANTNPETHIGTHTRTNTSEPPNPEFTIPEPTLEPPQHLGPSPVPALEAPNLCLGRDPKHLTSNGRCFEKIPLKIVEIAQRNMAASPAARRPPPWSSASAPGAPLAPKPEALAGRGRRWWAESSRPGRTWIPQGFHGALWVIYGGRLVTLMWLWGLNRWLNGDCSPFRWNGMFSDTPQRLAKWCEMAGNSRKIWYRYFTTVKDSV